MSSIDQSAITDGINGLLASGKGLLGNPIATAIGGAVVGGAVAGTTGYVLGATTASSGSSYRKKRKKARITHTKRGWKQDRKRRSKQKWEVAYQRRKRKGKHSKRKGMHYTKNGQPYIILKSGKARFVKKK